MTFRIRNTSGRLLCVELADGRTLHLAPGETSPEIGAEEARAGAIVDRLVAGGLLALSTTAAGVSKSARRKTPTRPEG